MNAIDLLESKYQEMLRDAFKRVADEKDATKVVQANMEFAYILHVWHFLAQLRALGAEVVIPKESLDKLGIKGE